MTKIRVDPDLLSKKSVEIHQAAGDLIHAGNGLLNEVMRNTGGGPYADLQSSARGDVFAARDLMNGLQRDLAGHADKLVALSRAFRSIDDEAISFLTGILGEGRLMQAFFGPPQYPDIEAFEPYDVPQTRIALTDWVPVFVMGPKGLTPRIVTDPDGKSQAEIYKSGHVVGDIVGTWADPKTGKKYYVVDLGGGEFGYIPVKGPLGNDLLGDPVDLSKIPYREGQYSDGMIVEDSSLPPPWGRQSWPQDWIDGQWWMGGPQQNLLLGCMGLEVRDKTGKLVHFLKSPHSNLCGELSVLASIGMTDVRGGLSIFGNIKTYSTNGIFILQHPNQGTTKENLVDFYHALGWEATGKPEKGQPSVMPSPDDLAAGLAAGHKYVFGVQLDLQTHKLTNSGDNVGHWVALTDVFQDDDGQVWVKAYDPYENREEIYSWEYFEQACKCSGKKNDLGPYTYVEAWQGGEGTANSGE